MRIEDEHPDVLQNIEFAIVTVYRENAELSDYDVMRTLEALVDVYRAEGAGREPRPFPLSPTEQDIYHRMRSMCEWRLGRDQLGVSGPEQKITPDPISRETLIRCLKRLQKSVGRWNREGGRQGYLQFISQFIR